MIRPYSEILIDYGRTFRRAYVARTVLLLVIVAVSAAGCIRADDLTLEQRQHVLERELMCPVCDGQTLDQSQAQISQDMKGVIISKLQAGESNAEIKEYFVARYGEVVLASPTTGGLNLLAWLMPVAITVGGGAIVFFALRGMRRPATADHPESVEPDLEPYLQLVDRHVGAAGSITRREEREESPGG